MDARHTIRARSAFSAYRETVPPERRVLLDRYRLCDLAFKVVGVGSVGTFCAVGLFVTADDEPMFLQIKEAQTSVLERIGERKTRIAHQGQRVVEGQRIMQAASDIFLGWTEDQKAGRFFYIRHLKNRRLGSIGEVIEGNALWAYATLCGRTLARAHARSGDFPPFLPVMWADPKPSTMPWRVSQWPMQNKPSKIMRASWPGWPARTAKSRRRELSTDAPSLIPMFSQPVRYAANCNWAPVPTILTRGRLRTSLSADSIRKTLLHVAIEGRTREFLRLAIRVACCCRILLALLHEAIESGASELLFSRLTLARQRGLIADGVGDTLLHVTVEGGTRELLRLAIGIASCGRILLAFGHEARQCGTRELLFGGLAVVHEASASALAPHTQRETAIAMHLIMGSLAERTFAIWISKEPLYLQWLRSPSEDGTEGAPSDGGKGNLLNKLGVLSDMAGSCLQAIRSMPEKWEDDHKAARSP